MIQERRKELQCDYTDRIVVSLDTSDKEFQQAISENQDYIMQETLSVEFIMTSLQEETAIPVTIAGHEVKLLVVVQPQ